MNASFLENVKEHLSAIDHCSKQLAQPLEDAADILFSCIVNGQKVFSIGVNDSTFYAQYFSKLLLNGFEQTRPSLPAIAITPTTREHQQHDLLLQQAQALCQPGDAFVIFDHEFDITLIQAFINLAKEQTLFIILLTNKPHNIRQEHMLECDGLLYLDETRQGRFLEIQLFLIHCLCDRIDQKLLGQG